MVGKEMESSLSNFFVQDTRSLGFFFQRMAKICATMIKTSAEPSRYLIKGLFSDAPVAVVVYLSFLLQEIK